MNLSNLCTENITILAFELRAEFSRQKFIQDLFDRAAKSADIWYGQKSVGYEIHKTRMLHRSALVVLAINTEDRVVGVSYIRKDGKRGALAVDPAFRGLGIAKKLVKRSLHYIPTQYTELPSKNDRLHSLFSECGFQRVTDWSRIMDLLKDLSSLVIEAASPSDPTYVRRSAHNSQRTRKYMMWAILPDSIGV